MATVNITGINSLKVLISILFLTLANVSFAEDDMRYYDVEIVIIENLSETAKNSENWPLHVNMVQPEKIVPLGQPVSKLKEWLPKDVDLKSSYRVLKSSSFKLVDKVEKISESKTKRVIFHTAWRQPGLDKHKALPIYFKHEIPAPPVIEDELSLESGQSTTSPSVLEGILRVTLARYLHLEAELSLQNKLPEAINSDNPFEILDNENVRNNLEKQGIIHLKQKRRRIRSNELHYLDHPVLGILIQITQYEKPEVIANTATTK